MDPYVYSGTDILINKLHIRDEQELIDVEAQLLIAGMLDISSIIHEINFQKHESLETIHRFLFDELYSWAGEFRTVNIYKAERVLNGLSIAYSDKKQISSDLKDVFNWANSIQWNYDNPYLTQCFSKFMTKLWRIHPYREGNTRTVSIFMKLFADVNELDFNAQILSQHAGYLRNALVLAAVEESSDTQYLLTMISDALKLDAPSNIAKADEKPNKYRVIEQHDVSKYEEKPFKTDFDSK